MRPRRYPWPRRCAPARARPILGLTAILVLTSVLAPLLPADLARAQTVYKYRDANGQWVFTDQAGTSPGSSESFKFAHEPGSLHVAVERTEDGGSTQLVAVNDCLCMVTFRLTIIQSGAGAAADGTEYSATLDPGTRKSLAGLPHAASDSPGSLRYTWRAAIGSPDAVHKPPQPYRVPFGIGSTYPVSQAYPSRVTHTTPESRYAVDIALPDGTPVYAARAGIVINTRHDFFRGGVSPVMLDQANVVAILHDDGTIGLYAHLHWDSIRVRIGAHVLRGQYIADSGNTGFTSGPHLHFAVLRNAGGEEVSVPFQFAGIAGVGVAPVNQAPLTAY